MKKKKYMKPQTEVFSMRLDVSMMQTSNQPSSKRAVMNVSYEEENWDE